MHVCVSRACSRNLCSALGLHFQIFSSGNALEEALRFRLWGRCLAISNPFFVGRRCSVRVRVAMSVSFSKQPVGSTPVCRLP